MYEEPHTTGTNAFAIVPVLRPFLISSIVFEEGLSAYYAGDWKTARSKWKKCGMTVAEVFLDRIGLKNAPAGWSGIWIMSTK